MHREYIRLCTNVMFSVHTVNILYLSVHKNVQLYKCAHYVVNVHIVILMCAQLDTNVCTLCVSCVHICVHKLFLECAHYGHRLCAQRVYRLCTNIMFSVHTVNILYICAQKCAII